MSFCVAAGWARIREQNTRGSKTVPQCDALRSRLKFWNESGTNRARIGDSLRMPLRSPQHLGLDLDRGTRSSFLPIDKPAQSGRILKAKENTESNQKRARVNRDSGASFSLLPLWEKVARTKSVPDEGYSIRRPLTRLRCFASQPPSPTRGEGKKAGPDR